MRNRHRHRHHKFAGGCACLERPGPMQSLVLEALAVFLAAGKEWVTGRDIAYASGMSEGSVYGCTSGMQNFHGRNWVVFEDRPRSNDPARFDTSRFWRITPEGMSALLKMKRSDLNG